MPIDRQQASTWSKDRIREELSDLRLSIEEMNQDILQTREEANSLCQAIDSGEHPYSRSSDPYKHTDAMYDYISRMTEVISQYESDIEFLKSLL